MSRPRGPSGPGISLFPFLAVLLCTMGALLVVLVIFSRSSAEQASQADEAVEALEAELESSRETLRARLAELDHQKRHANEQLSQARLRLAGIEEHARGLQDEMKSLQSSLASLVAGKNMPADAALDADLAKRLAAARESLDAAKMEAGTKPATYAVLPYEGASGTRRRPLYIECCGDGVFLQPEGIRLRPSDFEGPPGPGNPLASALRAAREHLASRPDAAGTTESQPYPLLLVRPSGVMAYYAARESISSWGSDFGYQLVDEEWQLAFPPADPTLADLEMRAIDEARARLQWLAEVRPKRPSKPATKYRASTTRGGVVSTEGPSVLGDQSRFEWNDADADRSSRGDALGRPGGGGLGGGGFSGGGLGGTGSAGGSRGGGSATGTAPLDRSRAESLVVGGGGRFGPGTGSDVNGGPEGRLGEGQLGQGQLGQQAGGQSGGGGEPRGTAGDPGGSGSFGAGSEGGLPGAAARAARNGGGPDGGTSADNGGSDAAAGGAAAGGDRPNGSGPPTGGSSTAGSTSAGDSGQPGGSSTGVAMPGMLQPAGGQPGGGSGASASVSFASSRGANWASLASRDRPIPLSRPIQIECAKDEFRIYDDANRRVVKRIPIEGATATAIDPLVKAVHERVATWGLAGDRMFWKPQLFLSETSDGNGRRGDLERLLADSGIETFHRGSTVAPLPAVADSPASATRPTLPRDPLPR